MVAVENTKKLEFFSYVTSGPVSPPPDRGHGGPPALDGVTLTVRCWWWRFFGRQKADWLEPLSL